MTSTMSDPLLFKLVEEKPQVAPQSGSYPSPSDEHDDDSSVDSRLEKFMERHLSGNQNQQFSTESDSRSSSPATNPGESTQENPKEDRDASPALHTRQSPPPPPAAAATRPPAPSPKSPGSSYFNPFTQHRFSPGTVPTLSPRRGISIWMDHAQSTRTLGMSDPGPLTIEDQDSEDSEGSEDGEGSEGTMDSSEELERIANEIRSEIRTSEMLELAREAERAAEAGKERFTGRASTFGDDMDISSHSDILGLKPTGKLRRNRTYSYSESRSLLRRSILMPRLERKIAVLSLRNINEVIPPLADLHNHLRTHLASNGVDQRTLLRPIPLGRQTSADRQINPKANSPDRIIRSFSSWVTAVASCDKEAHELSREELMLARLSSPMPGSPSSLPDHSLNNSLVATREDDGSSDKSITTLDSEEVGPTLADHLRTPPTAVAGHRPSPVKVPEGLEFPDSTVVDKSDRVESATLTTVPTSSSSALAMDSRKEDLRASVRRWDSTPSSNSSSIGPTPNRPSDSEQHDDRDGVAQIVEATPIPKRDNNEGPPGPPSLFMTPQRLRGIKKEVNTIALEDHYDQNSFHDNEIATPQIDAGCACVDDAFQKMMPAGPSMADKARLEETDNLSSHMVLSSPEADVGCAALAPACTDAEEDAISDSERSPQRQFLRPRPSDGYQSVEMFSRDIPPEIGPAMSDFMLHDRPPAIDELVLGQFIPASKTWPKAVEDGSARSRLRKDPPGVRVDSNMMLSLLDKMESIDQGEAKQSRPDPFGASGAARLRRASPLDAMLQTDTAHSQDLPADSVERSRVSPLDIKIQLSSKKSEEKLAESDSFSLSGLELPVGPSDESDSFSLSGLELPVGPSDEIDRIELWRARSPLVINDSHDTAEDDVRLNAVEQNVVARPATIMQAETTMPTPSDLQCHQCFVGSTLSVDSVNHQALDHLADQKPIPRKLHRVLSCPDNLDSFSLDEIHGPRLSLEGTPERRAISDTGQRHGAFTAAVVAMDAFAASMNKLPGGSSPKKRSAGRRCMSEAGSNSSFTAASVAMDVFNSFSHRRRRSSSVNDLYIPATENRDFLSNYLYCSKQTEHGQGGSVGKGVCENPCLAFGPFAIGCGAFAGAFSEALAGLAPKVSATYGSSTSLVARGGSYSHLEADRWFDLASEKMDEALERIVGSTDATWNMFQPPSLTKKTPASSPSPNRKQTPVVVLRNDSLTSRTDSEGTPIMTDAQFENWYGMSRDEFATLPVMERTSIHDSLIQGGLYRSGGSNMM